ncbi:WRKY family transcription factor [Tanacetum coccineum]
MTGETPSPTQPKQAIDKAYSIASIKACIPTPFDLDKLNYNSWSFLFKRFCRTYEVQHHLEAHPTTATSVIDPLHESNDSLVVMWMYSTISPKLVEMVVDDGTSAHGVWKRLKDLFHNNKDARVTQLDNEIRNMAIGSSSVTDFFQDIKSKADRLANLDSPKAPIFDELRSIMLLEESDMSHSLVSQSILHNTSSSPTVLVASTRPTDKANTMSTLGFDVCRNFQCGSCTYGARCKFVHGANDLRPRPSATTSTPQGRMPLTLSNRAPQNASNMASKPSITNTNRNLGQPCVAQTSPPVYSVQPTNMGPMPLVQPGPPGSTSPIAAAQFQQPGDMDYQTRRLLLRCDSTGDLYPVTQQPSSTITFALLSLSPTTWHRRLGHPSEDVLRRL